MTVDFTSIANISAMLAAILTPVVGYLNKDSQTYFLDLLAVPFTIFMITIVTSTLAPDNWSVLLFVIGISMEIVIYLGIVLEQYYYGKLKLTLD